MEKENKGNDHQQKNLLIVEEISLVGTLGNVSRTVWRIYILMIGCKGLNKLSLSAPKEVLEKIM